MRVKLSEVENTVPSKIVLADKLTNECSWISMFPKTERELNERLAFGETFEDLAAQLQKDCWKMVVTAEAKDGVGIAANQIGINKRMFVIASTQPYEYDVYFHPSWSMATDAQLTEEFEGCLSVPGVSVPVKRPDKIDASWFEFVNGVLVYRSEQLTDMRARIFQHEHDHILGQTIIDKGELNRNQRRSVLKQLKNR